MKRTPQVQRGDDVSEKIILPKPYSPQEVSEAASFDALSDLQGCRQCRTFKDAAKGACIAEHPRWFGKIIGDALPEIVMDSPGGN